MKDLAYQLGFVFSNYPAIKWMLVLAGVLLLILSLYKLSAVHTVASNGRTETRFRLPSMSIRKPKLNIELKHKTYSQSQRRWLSIVYRLQFLTFGILLFIIGLSLFTLACAWLMEQVAPGTAGSLLVLAFGGAFMFFGYLSVYYRDRGNPFKDG